jgi:hypothetical protein
MTGHDRFDRWMAGLGVVVIAAMAAAHLHQGYIIYGDKVAAYAAALVDLLP